MRLTVVTPCARPQNLARLNDSLDGQSLDWLVVHDCRSGQCDFQHPARAVVLHVPSLGGDLAGHAQFNAGLDYGGSVVGNDLVWRLDDDNLPVFGFFKRLRELERHYPGVDLFLFAQLAARRYDEAEWPGGVAYPVPIVTKMDSAQMVFRRAAAGPLRMKRDWYKADGQFAEDLYARVGQGWTLFVPEPLVLYNGLL